MMLMLRRGITKNDQDPLRMAEARVAAVVGESAVPVAGRVQCLQVIDRVLELQNALV